MLSPEKLTRLAVSALSGPEHERPDALFDLVELIASEEVRHERMDAAEAVQLEIYPLTAHFRESFEKRKCGLPSTSVPLPQVG